jgi:vacuolar-type H+-ATPase subunit I/STV1
MTEENKSFDEAMSKSKSELEALRAELNDLMVKFGLRTLRTYQTGKSYPLKPMEIKSLVKYEMDNVIADLSQPNNIEAIIKKTALELERKQKK